MEDPEVIIRLKFPFPEIIIWALGHGSEQNAWHKHGSAPLSSFSLTVS
jgi:hypothetical protein